MTWSCFDKSVKDVNVWDLTSLPFLAYCLFISAKNSVTVIFVKCSVGVQCLSQVPVILTGLIIRAPELKGAIPP